MEKETTGLYLTGHPMDAYRETVRRRGAVTIGSIINDFSSEEGATRYRDGQKVSIAGIVSAYKTRMTKNNTLMAYISLEDDTATIEMLAFSRTLDQSGGYITENNAVLISGKISVRDEKSPQIMVDDIRPLADMQETEQRNQAEQRNQSVQLSDAQRLYLRFPNEEDTRLRKVKLTLSMFPGERQVTLYMVDSGKRFGIRCDLQPAMLQELESILGKENIVLK